MDPIEFEKMTDETMKQLFEYHQSSIASVKGWIGEHIMDLTPDQVDRAMRIVKSIEKMGENTRNLATGIDLTDASWKRRILTAARDCGGVITTDRLREWMTERIDFSDYDLQDVKYGNETCTRWWHSMRPNLTYMTKDGTLTRERHGTYAITPQGDAYLES